MPVVEYFFPRGINALFEMPTEAVRRQLPPGLEPVEVNHGSALLGVTLFDFTDSPVGPYQELVISLYVVPLLGVMDDHPHAAVLPLVVASSCQAARDHAIDLWHLPHFMDDIRIQFTEDLPEGTITGKVEDATGQPILRLDIRAAKHWQPVNQVYQSFQQDSTGRYLGIIDIRGLMSEHEDNSGRLEIYNHPFYDAIDLTSLDFYPSREMWMRDGVERYHHLLSRP